MDFDGLKSFCYYFFNIYLKWSQGGIVKIPTGLKPIGIIGE